LLPLVGGLSNTYNLVLFFDYMGNLENIVSKSEKIKDGLLAVYPITCLSAISSIIDLGFPNESSFDISTHISIGASFYMGFSEEQYRKIAAVGIIASTYLPNIGQYFSEALSENFEQKIGMKIVGTIIGYSLGFVLKK